MDSSQYQIELVADGDLPPDVEWVFAEETDRNCLTLFLKRRAARRACVLAECWAAFRRISEQRRHRAAA